MDAGAGNGLATRDLRAAGYNVWAMDIASNAAVWKDERTVIVQPVWEPWPVDVDYGFCTDVMEHLPPDRVDTALDRFWEHCRVGVLFQICYVPDVTGPRLVGEPLHLTCRPEIWWQEALSKRWSEIELLKAKGGGQGVFWCLNPRTQ